MTTIQHPADPRLAGTLVEEEFVELVCSDAELVAAEFEAIIAAEWPTVPPARPPLRRSADPSRTPGHERWRRDVPGGPAQRLRRPGTAEGTRQRSPPRWVSNPSSTDRDGSPSSST